MRADTSRGTFEDILHSSNAEMTAVAYRLRDLFAEVQPDLIEVPRPGEQHAEYGLGPGRRDEIFAYNCPMQKYVRLGFYYGAALPDPAALLEGEGKRLRHVKIRSLSEAERPEIRQLIQASVEERQKALGAAR